MRISALSTLAVVACGALHLAPAVGVAGELRIQVLDRDGAPVPEVAVYAQAIETSEALEASEVRVNHAIAAADDALATPPTMNQRELSFKPHLLIVETGTEIAFPNEDDVRHHVYSFSPAKRFDLTIDSGSTERPIFDQAGIVTLGCNIHDDMLAYVLVVDTPHFTKTDANGFASLPALTSGSFEINIWTPRMSPSKLPEPDTVDLVSGEPQEISFQFDAKLYPPHEHSDTSLLWSHY